MKDSYPLGFIMNTNQANSQEPEVEPENNIAEFCREAECHKRIAMDNVDNEKDRQKIRRWCRHCAAHRYHKWLLDNGYSVVKKE